MKFLDGVFDFEFFFETWRLYFAVLPTVHSNSSSHPLSGMCSFGGGGMLGSPLDPDVPSVAAKDSFKLGWVSNEQEYTSELYKVPRTN